MPERLSQLPGDWFEVNFCWYLAIYQLDLQFLIVSLLAVVFSFDFLSYFIQEPLISYAYLPLLDLDLSSLGMYQWIAVGSISLFHLPSEMTRMGRLVWKDSAHPWT